MAETGSLVPRRGGLGTWPEGGGGVEVGDDWGEMFVEEVVEGVAEGGDYQKCDEENCKEGGWGGVVVRGGEKADAERGPGEWGRCRGGG